MTTMWVMQFYTREKMIKEVTKRRKRIVKLVGEQEVLSVKTITVQETIDFQ